jgi:hypothetical protein
LDREKSQGVKLATSAHWTPAFHRSIGEAGPNKSRTD